MGCGAGGAGGGGGGGRGGGGGGMEVKEGSDRAMPPQGVMVVSDRRVGPCWGWKEELGVGWWLRLRRWA